MIPLTNKGFFIRRDEIFMEVTIGEIIENIRLENINVEVSIAFGDNQRACALFSGINDAYGYRRTALELGFDVSQKVKMSSVEFYVERIIETLRKEIMDYQKEERENVLKRKIKDVEMSKYGWE